jgi:hypothetical protein
MHTNSSSNSTPQPRWPTLAYLMLYTLAIRLIPFALSRFGFRLDTDITVYPWNFSPLLAVCLYGGAFFPRRPTALWMPIVLTAVGDVAILALTGRVDMVSIPVSVTVALSAACTSLLGRRLRVNRRWLRMIGAGLLGNAVFFLVTNLASWVCYDSFPKTPLGLLECYAAGLLYLRNMMLGTAVFGGILFSPLGVRETSRRAFAEPIPT